MLICLDSDPEVLYSLDMELGETVDITKEELLNAWTMVNEKLKREQMYLGQWCTAAYAVNHWDIVYEKTVEVYALELEQSAIAESIREMETV